MKEREMYYLSVHVAFKCPGRIIAGFKRVFDRNVVRMINFLSRTTETAYLRDGYPVTGGIDREVAY